LASTPRIVQRMMSLKWQCDSNAGGARRGDLIPMQDVSRLSWKWRERSAVKITERTREETKEALHR